MQTVQMCYAACKVHKSLEILSTFHHLLIEIVILECCLAFINQAATIPGDVLIVKSQVNTVLGPGIHWPYT